MKYNDRGAVTVEAAITIPLFICIILSILFIIRIVFTYEIIGHSINETARDLAISGYAYEKSGLERKLADFSQEGSVSEISNLTNIIKSLSIINLGDYDKLTEYLDIIENPTQYLIEEGKTGLMIPITRQHLKRHIISSTGADNVDNALKLLGIKGGFTGINLTKSSYMKNGSDDIFIIAEYSVQIPVPFNIFPDMVIVQKACCRAWNGNGECSDIEEENVWVLDYRFDRNERLKQILESDFPQSRDRIFNFRSGKLVFMHSMDLTLNSYSNPTNVQEKVIEYIDYLSNFHGGKMGQNDETIDIKPNDIKERQLLLIVPRDGASDEANEVLNQCITYASTRNVILTVKKYGYKLSDEQ